jgi:hypothetical protein
MTDMQFWQAQQKWARGWLDKPENELPGALTREKLFVVLDEAEDRLIDYLGFMVIPGGRCVARYIDKEKNN